MLPAAFSALIVSIPTKCIAPNPKKIVSEKKIAVIQVVQEMEVRAVFASFTVKKRIKICGNPDVPNTNAIIIETESRAEKYLIPGFKYSSPCSVAIVSNIFIKLKSNFHNTKNANNVVPNNNKQALII